MLCIQEFYGHGISTVTKIVSTKEEFYQHVMEKAKIYGPYTKLESTIFDLGDKKYPEGRYLLMRDHGVFLVDKIIYSMAPNKLFLNQQNFVPHANFQTWTIMHWSLSEVDMEFEPNVNMSNAYGIKESKPNNKDILRITDDENEFNPYVASKAKIHAPYTELTNVPFIDLKCDKYPQGTYLVTLDKCTYLANKEVIVQEGFFWNTTTPNVRSVANWSKTLVKLENPLQLKQMLASGNK